ncbi:MAG: hypothetical protein QOJ97_1846 [Solirubrobacteraceae bacterium]|jgi:hypothetical protein|nr:hypothetical protein [Solirubrobacteraceae bacterium]
MNMSRAALAFQQTLEDLEVPEEALGDRAQQEQIGRRAALLATAELQWRDALGPLLSWREVADLLRGVGTRQGVNDLGRRGRLLALPTKDGRVLYPLFQLRDGRPLAVIPKVLAAFSAVELEPWTMASWFVSPQDELDRATPVEWLEHDGDEEQVVEAARRSAAALAR